MQTHSLKLNSADSQYASIADGSQTGLDLTSDFTIEFWIKIESFQDCTYVEKTAGVGGYRVLAGSGDYDDLVLQYWDGSSNKTEARVTALFDTTDDLGKWVHIAVTVDVSDTTSGIKIYKNGRSLSVTYNNTNATSVAGDSETFYIGSDSGAGSYADAYFKDVRVFSDIRTASEVVSDAHTENVSNANLEGEWNFNDALTDGSGNGNTLSLSGSPIYTVDIPWEAPAGIESSVHVGRFVPANSEYLSITDASQTGLDLSGDFTFEAWVRIDAVDEYVIIAKGDVASNRAYFWRINSNGNLTAQISGDGTGTNRDIAETDSAVFTTLMSTSGCTLP